MYDTPDYHLVANPVDRYSIGDRTPGLAYGDDGSVTIYLQTEAPAGDKQANWLPAPAGDFRPVLRMYQAGPSVLDGTYPLPPIRRTDGATIEIATRKDDRLLAVGPLPGPSAGTASAKE
jgi:hypothetical protein